MPGITGIISKQSPERNHYDLSIMVNSMKHEPIYISGSYVNENLGLYLGWVTHKGSFVDCLPIWNEKRDKCLIFYGETFTDRWVHDTLKGNGHQFDSGDASYLIHLFEELGDKWYQSLNGFFNGVMIDTQRNECILFNDRYGMQRIYYHENVDKFLFSSEAKALLKICPDLKEIVPASLGQLFSMGCVLDNNTLYKNIYLLPGASKFHFINGKCNKKDRYFNPKYWENQDLLEKEQFYCEVKNKFIDILPRYMNDTKPIAMSLTGGLDTRMIMAHAHRPPETMACYTFGSMYRDSFDVKIARKIAKKNRQNHYTIRVDNNFINNFAALAEKTVYITDGYLDVSGATELYVNKLARNIAPIRITGNYGSEVLRSIRAFRARPPKEDLFNGDFVKHVNLASYDYNNATIGNKLTFTLFKEAPWFHYNRLSLEQSQLTVRSPFMDNDFVSIIYRAPHDAIWDDHFSLRLIKDGNIEMSKIITDRGVGGNSLQFLYKPRIIYYEILRLAELCYDYGMPQRLARVDRYLSPLHIEKLFLGQHKFYHFRIWFRNELSGYLKDMLLDHKTLQRPYWNGKFVEKMVSGHIKGDRNYTTAIEKVLTIELIYRLLIEK